MQDSFLLILPTGSNLLCTVLCLLTAVNNFDWKKKTSIAVVIKSALFPAKLPLRPTCCLLWTAEHLCDHRSLKCSQPLTALTLKPKTFVSAWAALTTKNIQADGPIYMCSDLWCKQNDGLFCVALPKCR